MVFKKKKATKKKNVTKTFVDGKEETEQDPEVPTPPGEEKVEEQPKAKVFSGQEVYEGGRSVGFQEGMIYAIQLLDDTLKQHQAELKKRIAEKKGE